MKALITTLLLFPIIVFGQITDTWDAVKVGTTDMSKIYVGNTLVWQKPTDIPIAYKGSGGLASIVSTTLDVPIPSNSSGNLLIMIVGVEATTTINTPSGWTLDDVDSGYGSTFAVFHKFIISSESGTQPVTFGVNVNGASGIILCFEGVSEWNSGTAKAWSARSLGTNIVYSAVLGRTDYGIHGIGTGYVENFFASTANAGGWSFATMERVSGTGTVSYQWDNTYIDAGLILFYLTD